MSVELKSQLREYCRDLEQRQGALSFADIFERSEKVQVIPRRGDQQRAPRRKWAAAAVLALAALVVAIGSWLLVPADGNRQPADQSTTTSLPATVDTLPALGLPGMAPNLPAGEYGWTGASGSRGWMHSVVEDLPSSPGEFRQTQIVFAVENDCFPGAPGADPTPVTVAGLDGLYLEPYDDTVWETTGAYALPIGDRTLCVYLWWDPTTTPDELSALHEVVQSIRGVPFGEDGIRINFTLPAGWDTG